MGRGVSYPNNSLVTYTHFEYDDGLEDYLFDEYVDDYKTALSEKFPSLWGVDEWLGREDRAILSNYHVKVGISEYYGTVALWVLPDPYELAQQGLACRNAQHIHDFIEKTFGTIRKIGTMSNGVSLYEPKGGHNN